MFCMFIRLNDVIMRFCCIVMQFALCRSPAAYLFGPRFRQVGSTVLICGKHGGHVSEANLRLFRALNPAVSRWNFCPDFDKPLSVCKMPASGFKKIADAAARAQTARSGAVGYAKCHIDKLRRREILYFFARKVL